MVVLSSFQLELQSIAQLAPLLEITAQRAAECMLIVSAFR